MNKMLLIFLFSAIITVFYSLKKIKIKYSILSALTGIICLIAIDYIGSFAGINLPVNMYSLGISAVGGIPAVILLTLLDTFLI